MRGFNKRGLCVGDASDQERGFGQGRRMAQGLPQDQEMSQNKGGRGQGRGLNCQGRNKGMGMGRRSRMQNTEN